MSATKVVLLDKLCSHCNGISKRFESSTSACPRCETATYCSQDCFDADRDAHAKICQTREERIDDLDGHPDRGFIDMGLDLDAWLKLFVPTTLTGTILFSALGLPQRTTREVLLIEVVPNRQRPLFDYSAAFYVTRVKSVNAMSLEMFYAAPAAYGISNEPGKQRQWSDVVDDYEQLAEADAGDLERDQHYLIINAIVFSKSTAAHASLFEDEKWQARALIARVDQGDWRYDEQWEDKVKVGTPPVPEWTAAPQVVGR